MPALGNVVEDCYHVGGVCLADVFLRPVGSVVAIVESSK